MTPTEIIRAELARINAQIAPLEKERALLLKLALKINGAALGNGNATAAPDETTDPAASSTESPIRVIRRIIADAGSDGIDRKTLVAALQAATGQTKQQAQSLLSYMKSKQRVRIDANERWHNRRSS